MTIKIALHHHTSYTFDRPIEIMPHIVRLRPAPHCRTPIQSYSLKVTPETHFINWQQDPFSNYLARLVFPERSRKLVFDVEVIADMTIINPFDFFLEEKVEHFPFNYDEQLIRDLSPYLEIRERGPLLKKWLKKIDRSKQATISFLVALNAELQKEVAYLIRLEAGVQSCEETLEKKSGSCRDSAWLLVQILRHLGLAARFVSGYLVQLTADVKALDGPSGPEQDFTDLHAWTEVYIPGAGWIGLDPTSGLFAAEGHIPLACTPDPVGAAPVTGATEQCDVSLKYFNKVTRIHEDPRVTKPYSETQWRQVDQLGKFVDQKLKKQDVRLTMGGEPTFVSIDDMDGAQWNTAALGKEKLELSEKLIRRLKKQFGSKGFLHFGQGKWYPGEPLPRWALGLFWRSDKKALWKDDKLLATALPSEDADNTHAKKFMTTLCRNLNLDTKCIIPGYEDSLHYLIQEGALPGNVTVDDNKLKDPLERERLRQVFSKGLDLETGFALPINWHEESANSGWESCRWQFRRGKMYLLPGDSSMGYRMPLNSLPWQEEEAEQKPALDPFAEKQPLAKPEDIAESNVSKKQKTNKRIFHTAVCVESRGDRLFVFMPPLSHLEEYLRLLAAVENTARDLKMPVFIEGYEPPRDNRLKKLMVTPDPGVIEVNVHPAASWQSLLNIIRPLYEDARQCRLGTEKFMLDGKHTGTGGGNHVTLGAENPQDSPFLRRPDLLASMLRYWQNHPSLSYLFSGQFIGPTSQAPRVDEARDDNLYELEIALQQLPRDESTQPWLVDRILRNFLIDMTGNTHRAEFCIDKLYAPGSASGRLGLVEFRNFEMPPHWQMSAVQMLLLRCLVSWFWQQPYQKPFIRWGNQLHDRFMLPHFIWEDIKWVIKDLNEAGYQFALDWMAPFQEFRFPHLGRVHVAGLQVDLHAAIEPWHVLGEETSAQGTSRYVDSSVERLQVTVKGISSPRLKLYCNGRPVPLQASGKQGEYLAGIRYKAWAPYSALHPTIDVHTPLIFDIVDQDNGRSLGGCRYYVSHPGGRNYDTFPVNANEAEARRVARFTSHGHTQGPLDIREQSSHPDQPYTLDLRFLNA